MPNLRARPAKRHIWSYARMAWLTALLWFASATVGRADYTAFVDPSLVVVTNFQGWGTSLCWWANVIGGYPNRDAYVDLAFTQLKLNIVRYNIGGGENPASNNIQYRARMEGFEPANGVWNWNADANQRWVLRQALNRGVDHVEAFANSPPWWMTVSSSVTGSTNGTSNNLRTDSEDDFALYLATVVSNLTVLDSVTFDTVTPMNEPQGTWTYGSTKQEGCHMNTSQQARMVNQLRAQLNVACPAVGIVASEDSATSTTLGSLSAYDDQALGNVSRIVSHTYGTRNRTGLRDFVISRQKPMWMTEYGDSDASGLTMAQRIHDDLAVSWFQAWVYWQVVDNAAGWGFLRNSLLAPTNANYTPDYTFNQKFYVMAQFSQFIRPGCQIISVNDSRSLAAYHPGSSTLVIVTVNNSTNSFNVTYDLSGFAQLPPRVLRSRTSTGESLVALAPLPVAKKRFDSLILPQSVTTHVLTNVVPPLAINSQNPAGDFTLYQSQKFTLSVNTSALNLNYQWYTNGVADTAAGTGPTYVLTDVQPAMSGTTFQCTVTNAFAEASSTPVTLTVLPLPSSMTSSSYSASLLALNPTAYWPMHETTPPAQGNVETNHGTLGAVGNGYYADWNVNNGSPGNQVIQHQIAGALANDSDGAVMFNFNGTANSYLLVPHTSPGTTLRPPFTVECWVWSSDANFGDIISQDGTMLNVGNANNQEGFRISWNRGNNIQTYGTAGGLTGGTSPLNQWNYVAVTYDGTNQILYVNGTNSASTVHTGYVVDYWDPLTIGNGLWNDVGPTRAATHIAIDEVAVYDTVLEASTLTDHYNLGSSGLAGEYFTAVTNSEPLLYYRMDAPAYNTPDSSTWPVMTNYGTVAINGTYQPGLAPGSYEGPNSADGLAAANSAPMNGLSTFALATPPDASVFSPPTGTSPFSFSLWFKSNPSDCRYQSLLSHGNGWQLAQQTVGTLQFYLGTYLNTTGVYNDGNWHHVVVTYATNTGNIYVDGVLDSTKTDSTLISPAPAVYALGIGCDTRFTAPNNSGGAGRQYAGNICEVAFWNGTALSASQVQGLYDASSGVPPRITTQPVSASVDQGAAFTNTVAAVGSEPLAYQWYHDGLPQSAHTSASLELASVRLADAGSWYVVVTNASGMATSSVGTLTVIAAVPTISLDRLGRDLVITYTGTLLSSTNVAGPYEPVTGASTPYTVPRTDAQRFYRTSNP